MEVWYLTCENIKYHFSNLNIKLYFYLLKAIYFNKINPNFSYVNQDLL